MTETEVVKIVLNNGFMALFVVWVLFRGEPKYRETLLAINSKNAALIKAMSDDARHTIESMRETFAATIETVSTKFEGIIKTMHGECREERRDLMDRMLANEDKDREARHKQGNDFMRALAEIHENHPPTDGARPVRGTRDAPHPNQ